MTLSLIPPSVRPSILAVTPRAIRRGLSCGRGALRGRRRGGAIAARLAALAGCVAAALLAAPAPATKIPFPAELHLMPTDDGTALDLHVLSEFPVLEATARWAWADDASQPAADASPAALLQPASSATSPDVPPSPASQEASITFATARPSTRSDASPPETAPGDRLDPTAHPHLLDLPAWEDAVAARWRHEGRLSVPVPVPAPAAAPSLPPTLELEIVLVFSPTSRIVLRERGHIAPPDPATHLPARWIAHPAPSEAAAPGAADPLAAPDPWDAGTVRTLDGAPVRLFMSRGAAPETAPPARRP